MNISAIINDPRQSPGASSAEDGSIGITSTSIATPSAPTVPGMGVQSSCHDSPSVTADYSDGARLIVSSSDSPSQCVDLAVRPEQAQPAVVTPTTDARARGQKRPAQGDDPAELSAEKKQSKWSTEEDRLLIELRGNGMKWEDIAKHFPGRSGISCRLRFQNYLERRSGWDEEEMNKFARLYQRQEKSHSC